MRRALGWGLGVVLAGAALAAVLLWSRVSGLDVEPVRGDVYAIFGLGGNVGVLRTDRGAVVVDTMTFRLQGDRIRERAERLAGGPVQAVVNTHYHADHTHGNPAFPGGLPIVATERTRRHLLERDADYWQGARAETLPNQVLDTAHELHIGGKTIRAIHPGAGHTDGDLVVLFVEDRVIHTGDLFFHRRYPFVDLEAGGSVPAWIASLDRVIALEFDRVIPGHGAITDRASLRDFQAFLQEVWDVATRAAAEGWTQDETLRRARLERDAGYERIWVPFVIRFDRDFVLRLAWQEATARAVATP